jgi:hypothetical protein
VFFLDFKRRTYEGVNNLWEENRKEDDNGDDEDDDEITWGLLILLHYTKQFFVQWSKSGLQREDGLGVLHRIFEGSFVYPDATCPPKQKKKHNQKKKQENQNQ